MFVRVLYRSLSYCATTLGCNGRCIGRWFLKVTLVGQSKLYFARRGGILFVVVYSHEKFPQGLRRSHGQPLIQTQVWHIVIGSHTQLSHPIPDNKIIPPPRYSYRSHRTRCLIWRQWALNHTHQYPILQTHWNRRGKHKLSMSWKYSAPMSRCT